LWCESHGYGDPRPVTVVEDSGPDGLLAFFPEYGHNSYVTLDRTYDDRGECLDATKRREEEDEAKFEAGMETFMVQLFGEENS